MLKKIIRTDNDNATFLIRLLVGVVFLSEGIQKFLFPAVRGAGRFEGIGLPNPEFLGFFVGSFEVLSGMLILTGFMTRVAVLPTITIMIVAISTTKVSILAEKGFWEMMHASRTDWSMLLGSIFLLFRGAGAFSFDRRMMKKHKA
jgi:putative oxidoreductase